MKKPDYLQLHLFAALLFIAWPVSAQQYSIDDSNLMNKLAENKEFIDYICPNEREKCGDIAEKIEIKPIELTRRSSTTTAVSKNNFYTVSPIRKGKQFPTLVFRTTSDSVSLIAEDWDTGLKVLPKVRNGMYTLEGRSITGPAELEVYRLKWKKTNYQEYSRKCYRIRTDAENISDKLIAVPCQ